MFISEIVLSVLSPGLQPTGLSIEHFMIKISTITDSLWASIDVGAYIGLVRAFVDLFHLLKLLASFFSCSTSLLHFVHTMSSSRVISQACGECRARKIKVIRVHFQSEHSYNANI